MSDDEYCYKVQMDCAVHFAQCGFGDLALAFENLTKIIEELEE